MKYLPLFTLLLLTACGNFGAVTSGPNPFAVTPSRAPIIFTATPLFFQPTTSATLPPPPSLTSSFTPEITSTFSLTPEPSLTFTFIPSSTSTPFPVELIIHGCNTGVDVTHGMGEVTNTYVTLVNRGGPDLTNACLTLSAADEGRAHPDKTVCVPALQTGFQITLKLTVDTTTNTATLIQVSFTSDQLSRPPDSPAACIALGRTVPSDSILGIPVPIP